MIRIFKILICRVLPFFSNRKLAINQEDNRENGTLFSVTTVEPEVKAKRNGDSFEKELRNLQKTSREVNVHNIIELSDSLMTGQSAEITLLIAATQDDVLQPIQKKYSAYFTNLNKAPRGINEAIYWESKTK